MSIPQPSLLQRVKEKALWFSYLVQSPWWNHKEAQFFPVKHGKLFLDPREGWRAFLRAHDTWEPAVIEKLPKVLRSGDRVLDLGSNYGEFVLQMAGLIGNEGTVTGVEMDPHYVTILHLVKAYNPSLKERFTIIPAPLSAKNNLEWIFKQTQTIPTFYFADIEGAEQELVKQVFAHPKWTKDSPRFLLELHPEIYGEKIQDEIIARFTKEGYSHEAVDYKHYYFWR